MLIAMTLLAIWLGTVVNRPPIAPENIDQLTVVDSLARDIWEMSWSHSGDRVALLGWGQPAEIREAKTLFHFKTLAADKKPIHFAFSPDRNVVAYCENGTAVEIVDLASGGINVIETGDDQPEIEFSPDGKILATGGYGIHAKLWDVASGHLIRTLFAGPPGGLLAVFSPDGKIVAVGNRNSSARLFDAATGQLLHVLTQGMTHGMRFDPSGKRLAVAYVDGSIAVWDVASGRRLHRKPSGAKEMYEVDWSPDGRLLVSAGREGDIVIWDPGDLTVLRRLPAPEWVIGVRFTPDGTRLLTAGGTMSPPGNREVQIWGIPTPWTRWQRAK